MKESEALNRAAALCSSSEKCDYDIRKKLQSWDVDSEVIDRIINRLKEDKFIDQVRYASHYVRDKFKFNKWGKRKIEFELRNRFIESEIINEALEFISDEEYFYVLHEILEQKLKGIKNKSFQQQKSLLFRFAVSRGFDGNITYKVINDILDSSI
ncbi:MAG: RecX family transcriptional regulator [Marinilabiliaceae bacterium]|nr:RecX family transcriptional regulator [Marinilabiliaceae bacterium]